MVKKNLSKKKMSKKNTHRNSTSTKPFESLSRLPRFYI
jgi:hypothetical protein